jgi:hypothetical protein
MKSIAIILLTFFTVSACSIKEPRMAFGKKCDQNGDKITYSYVWIYDKNTGLPANEEQCAALPEKEEK